jgi:hypothetical protein
MPFVPASDRPYECTIHTLRMTDDAGDAYDVVLDLIRSNANPEWGVTESRLALRAAVVELRTKSVIASRFVEAPAAGFELQIMDASGHIGFSSPDLSFDLTAVIHPSTIVQSGTERLKNSGFSTIELLVTDYPKTEHTGTLTLPDRVLRASATPSTLSHHYGNRLVDYVFMASVRVPNEPSFIAVVARDSIEQAINVHVGYVIHTDGDGDSHVSLMLPDAEAGELGSSLLGKHITAGLDIELGALALNGGALPSKTALGHATLGAIDYPEVIIDVTGAYLQTFRP